MKCIPAQALKKIAVKFSIATIIIFFCISYSANAQPCNALSNSWCLFGNSSTTSANFVGTTDPVPLIFKTHNNEWIRIDEYGNTGIGTPLPSTQLHTTGGVRLQTLTGTGIRFVLTDQNGNLSAGSGTGSGIVTGSGSLNYVPKWTPDGTALGNSSIFDNGNVGLGTTIPQAKFQIKNGSVLFDGTLDNNPPVNGSGTRMMWIPSKASFRSGVVTGSTWDYANIGTASTAFGYNTQANGDYSSAFGYGSIAQSYNSFVIGQYNIVSGTPSSWVATEPLFVIGNGVYNDGKYSGPKALTPISLTGIVRHNALTVLKNGNVGIGPATPINKLDVQGGVAIGNSYAGIKVSPLNGAIIRGNVGIGTATPVNKLDIEGGIAIGATYSGSKIAPANGAIIEGNVGIGTDLSSSTYDATYKLAVNGAIRAKRVVVETIWSDFVFEKNYKLKSLEDVENFIKINGHLPEIPSAKEIETNGGDVGELLKLQMQKIEELMLYVIELKKEINKLKK